MNPDLRETTKELFGNPVRVQLAHWVRTEAPEDGFSLKTAQAALSEEAGTAVRAEILKLEKFGLIKDEGSHRERKYRIEKDCQFWSAFEAIAQTLDLPGS